jgi:hypothetical protein
MVYVSRPRAVNCGLQLRPPYAIRTGTAPHLMGTNAYVGKRLSEQDAPSEQLEQDGTFVRRELSFRLPTFPLPLERCASRPAVGTVATGADTGERAMCCRDSATTARGIRTMFDGQQLRQGPGSRTELAAPSPMDKARRPHVQKTGGLPLARHESLAVHRVSVP